ncbi:MAG: hypothetical protein EA397_19450 [Deltaproteobacteria bacterium]|nr:MAG: hypothetical protein EA397_19450 [Deltaproteobacteria bacterium]
MIYRLFLLTLLIPMCSARTVTPSKGAAAETSEPELLLPEPLQGCSALTGQQRTTCVSSEISSVAVRDLSAFEPDLCDVPGVDPRACLVDVGYGFARFAEAQEDPSVELLRARMDLGARILRNKSSNECRWQARVDLARFVTMAVAMHSELSAELAESYHDVVGGVPDFRRAVGLLDPETHEGLRSFLIAATYYRSEDSQLDFPEVSHLKLRDDGTYEARLRGGDMNMDAPSPVWSTVTGTWSLPEPKTGGAALIMLDERTLRFSEDYHAMRPVESGAREPSGKVGDSAWDLREYAGELECPPEF